MWGDSSTPPPPPSIDFPVPFASTLSLSFFFAFFLFLALFVAVEETWGCWCATAQTEMRRSVPAEVQKDNSSPDKPPAFSPTWPWKRSDPTKETQTTALPCASSSKAIKSHGLTGDGGEDRRGWATHTNCPLPVPTRRREER